jgi:CheY-like chemotaxis protein
LIFFNNGVEAIKYLEQEDVVPVMIFSDINMPGMNGFQLRDQIHANPDLRVKCVPFLFLPPGALLNPSGNPIQKMPRDTLSSQTPLMSGRP